MRGASPVGERNKTIFAAQFLAQVARGVLKSKFCCHQCLLGSEGVLLSG